MLLLEVISNEQLVKPDRGRMRLVKNEILFLFKIYFLDFIKLLMSIKH